MRNEIVSIYYKKPTEENRYAPLRWYESENDVFTMNKMIKFNRELEQLHQEAEEEDFLLGRGRVDI